MIGIVAFKFLGIGLGFFILILSNKFFGKTYYGYFSYYFSLTQIFSILILYGLDIKFFKFPRSKYEDAIFQLIFRFIILFIISFFLGYKNILFILSIVASFFLALRILNSVFLRLNQLYIKYALIDFLSLNVVFIILLVWFYLVLVIIKVNPPKSIIYLIYCLSLFISTVLSFVVVPKFYWKQGLKVRFVLKNYIVEIKKGFSYVLPNFLWILLENIDILLVKNLFSFENTGAYAVMLKLSSLLLIPVMILNSTYLGDLTYSKIRSIRNLSFFLNIITAGILIFSKDQIFHFFSVPEDLYVVYLILILSFFVPSLFGVTYQTVQVKAETVSTVKILVQTLIIEVLLSLALYNFIGLNAISLARLIAFIFLFYKLYEEIKCLSVS